MAAVTSPLRACRGLLKELRIAKGSGYRNSVAYKHVLEQFRRNQVTEAYRDHSVTLDLLHEDITAFRVSVTHPDT
uniref:Uncharacterized protein n=1 Tax=Sinocyclocheilus anshuiensis TaxID=1608454 RepID=A0A671Q651_9TELE